MGQRYCADRLHLHTRGVHRGQPQLEVDQLRPELGDLLQVHRQGRPAEGGRVDLPLPYQTRLPLDQRVDGRYARMGVHIDGGHAHGATTSSIRAGSER